MKDYENALKKGYELLKKEQLLRNAHILEIQKRLERNNAGFRKQSGTTLINPTTGEIKHTPRKILVINKNLWEIWSDTSTMIL